MTEDDPRAPHPRKSSSSANLHDKPVTPDTNISTAIKGNGEPGKPTTQQGFVGDNFWIQSEIDGTRWNKLYPYQLMILKLEGVDTYYVPEEHGMVYTLPVPPESLTISMPFAISTSATMGGIVEEHNGAPFRNINISGSTGVLLQRGNAERPNAASFLGNFIGGGNIEALASGTVNAIKRAAGDDQQLKNRNLHTETEFSDKTSSIGKSTGYYQMRQLQRFFEHYASLKKSHHGRDFRMGLAIWKDQAVYLVTPQVFNVEKNQGSPLSYQYNMTFKAYRRVRVEAGGKEDEPIVSIYRRPGAMFRVLNSINDARIAVQNAGSLVAAVLGSVEALTEPLRQLSTLTKESLNLALTIADIPTDIKNRIDKNNQYFTQQGQDIANIADDVKKAYVSRWEQSKQLFQSSKGGSSGVISSTSGGFSSLGIVEGSGQASAPGDSGGSSAISSNGGGSSASNVGKPPMGTKDDPNVSDQTNLDDLPLSADILAAIEQARQDAISLTRKEIEAMRDEFRRQIDALAAAIGLGHETFSNTFNQPAPTLRKAQEDVTDEDHALLFTLNKAAQAMDSLAATGGADEPSSTEAKMQAMAQMVRGTGIAFIQPASKFAIPFPYGATLESLAARYLGDPNRWHEIATLNGLKEPYIDEVGVDTYLEVNGYETSVVVKTNRELFYIGQVAYIWSDGVRRTRRTIESIKDGVDGYSTITLSGDADMYLYTTAQRARISVFLPDTVNSQGMIYIPSDVQPADDDFITRSIPGVNEFDPMVAVGGVDFLTDNHGNLIVTPEGDNSWAVGLQNIIQNLRAELSVRRGSLMHHPGYGLPVVVGSSTAEVSPQDILESIRKMVTNNPSIARVDAIRINKNGPTMTIDASIVVKGIESPVPLRYDVKGDYQKTT